MERKLLVINQIYIRNLNPKKDLSVVADNEVRNAIDIKISENKKYNFNLLYNKNKSIEKN